MVSIPHLRASYIVLAMTKHFLVEHPILKSIARLLVMLKMTIVVKEIETKFHKGSYSEEHPFGFLNIILIYLSGASCTKEHPMLNVVKAF